MEKELDLVEIWMAIAKRWKMILFIPLVAALASALISLYVIVPEYEASTTMMVVRPADSNQLMYQDVQLNRQLVGTYREIVHSRRVLEIVIAKRSLPYDVTVLRSKVDVQSVRDTELITVNVTHDDPVLARDIANEVARAFMEQIIEIMQIENVSVVDEAVTPRVPVSPRVPLNVGVALVVGLMAAIGLAFLNEYLDQTIKDPAEAERLLDLPVIGVIPEVENSQLFTFTNPRSPASEAFRSLRTNIQYAGVDREIKKIVISGANPACGKSTMSANLGITLAQTGASVLIVDADLRKPTQHRIFNVASEPGLSSLVFNQELSLAQAVHRTEHEKLSVLPSGPIPPYPAELLGSERMKKLIALFSENFDYVIFDTPPIIAVTDAAVLAPLVDGILLVLDYGRVRRDEAAGALEQLRKVQANVIGAVLNGFSTGKGYYNGYSYYYGAESMDEYSGRSKKKKGKGGSVDCATELPTSAEL